MRVKTWSLWIFWTKLIVVTAIFYAGLTYKQGFVGERDGTNYFADYLDELSDSNVLQNYSHLDNNYTGDEVKLLAQRWIQDAMDEIYSPVHGVSIDDSQLKYYEKKYQDICVSNFALCMKVHFKGDLNYKDKFMYMASMIQVLTTLDSNITTNPKFASKLDEIEINDEDGSRRGHSTWDTIVINVGTIDSYSEFLDVFTHEVGHIFDLGLLYGVGSSKDSNFTEFGRLAFTLDDPSLLYYSISRNGEKVRKSIAQSEDFCSGYGMVDPFEDLSECFNLYMNHNSLFKAMAQDNNMMKKKYNFIANYFGGSYVFSPTSDIDYIQDDITRRPFDTTKI